MCRLIFEKLEGVWSNVTFSINPVNERGFSVIINILRVCEVTNVKNISTQRFGMPFLHSVSESLTLNALIQLLNLYFEGV